MPLTKSSKAFQKYVCFAICVFFILTYAEARTFQTQQEKVQDSLTTPSIIDLWGTSNALNNTRQYDKVLEYLEKHIKNVSPQNEKDSLDVADLYYNQFEANYYTGKYLESIQSANNGLPYCKTSTSDRGKHIKGVFYYKRAYGESEMNFAKRAKRSMKTALEYLSEDYESSLDYLVDAHVFLSSQASYHGNSADAQRYIRLAKKTYQKHKTYLDKVRKDNYEIVLTYREAYVLYKLGQTKEDSLAVVAVLDKLEQLHDLPTFNKKQQVYYTTSLNHIGDWYISHKHDSLITTKDIEAGTYYLDKSIDLVKNKEYTGNISTFNFNKCKALTLDNKLPEAETLIQELLNSISETDYRRSFFLAQKALIKAKLKQKDSALQIFHNVIEHVHTGKTQLAKDYHNFLPSKVYGEARLIRRVAEKLEKYYSDDPEVKKTIARLYDIAFIQFENSYARTKFNPNQNDLLREILQGTLVAKKEAPSEQSLEIESLLGSTETIMNQMSWQRFYQNRFTNKLPELDSLNFRHLSIRTQLTAAIKENNTVKLDSLEELLRDHSIYSEKIFPNLELMSSQIFDMPSLQAKLDKDELVLKYILFEDTLAIFSIAYDTIEWELRPWTATEIQLEEALINSIRDRKYDVKTASLLSEKLLPKIDSKFTKIIINPDGELYRIPFEILQQNEQFLTENYEVRYTSNLGFIDIDHNSQPVDKGVLAIYAPSYPQTETAVAVRANTNSFLKGAQKEAKIISRLFPSKTYVGKNISKADFLRTSPKAGILHLAMHAEIDENEPGLSRLLFNKNNKDEDDLYLEELYALQLKADLAVLSACNTGLGKESAGRSLESFQRAFTFSGVPATVVSLWEVPDQSTSEIMGSFYQYLKNGDTKSKALKKAKLNYLSKHQGTKLVEPYYWTGFVLYGDESVVDIPSSKVVWYVLIALLLIISISFFRKNLTKKA